MKKVKIMKKDFLRPKKAKEIFFVLAVVCLIVAVWMAILYQKSNQRFRDTERTISEQVSLVNQLYISYVETLQGDVTKLNAINADKRQFNSLLNTVQTASSEEHTGQMQLVNRSWKKAEGMLATMVQGQSVLAAVDDLIKKTSAKASEVHAIAENLKQSLSSANGVLDLSSQLDGLMADMNSLNGLLNSVTLIKDATSVTDSLEHHADLSIQLADSIEDELAFQGSQAFNGAAKDKEIAKLIKNLKSIPVDLAGLVKQMPNYTQITKSFDNYSSQSKALTKALQGLKGSYADAKTGPVSFIPLSYSEWLIGLLILAGVFLALWAWMLVKDSNRIRNDAITVHAEAEGARREAEEASQEAEETSQRDQAAILRLMDELDILSNGDLTVKMEVTEDFTGAIADSINYSIESMRDMVGTITLTSEQVLKATADTQGVAKLLADSSQQQSEEISRSNDTVGRISISLEDIAQHSDSSAEIAQSSVNIAQDGRERVKRTVKSMWDIRDNIKDTSKRIKRLGESSQEIGDIVEIIKGIADQTNILALNAAIQATSAGEAGKGFAVVADEVQRLAERSGEATKQIETLVKTIQADANEAVASMESSTTQVVNGTAIAEEAGESLDKIEQVSHNLSNLIINVSDGTRKAANLAQDVVKNMDNLAALNKKSVKDVTSSVRSVDMLGELSELLKESIAGFKLPEDQ